MMIVRSLSVSCVAARRTSLVLLALVVLMAFGASGREWTSCGLGVLELWPSVGCLSPSLTYRFITHQGRWKRLANVGWAWVALVPLRH